MVYNFNKNSDKDPRVYCCFVETRISLRLINKNIFVFTKLNSVYLILFFGVL